MPTPPSYTHILTIIYLQNSDKTVKQKMKLNHSIFFLFIVKIGIKSLL